MLEEAVASQKHLLAELEEFARWPFPNGLPKQLTHSYTGADGIRHEPNLDTNIPGEFKTSLQVAGMLFDRSGGAEMNSANAAAMAVADPITGRYDRGFSIEDDGKERINKLKAWSWFIGDVPLRA